MTIDPDKAREYLDDVTASSELMSNCCGARMYELGDNYICMRCKEHCEPVESE